MQIKAVSINPIDFKKRKSGWLEPIINSIDNPLVVGYDAAGEVLETGKSVKYFTKGD